MDAFDHQRFWITLPAIRRGAVCLALAIVALHVAPAPAIEELQQPTSGAWATLRTNLYGDQRLDIAGDGFMRIEMPANTPDPAATAIGLRFGDDAIGQIRRLRVIIDNNPSPLAATFDIADGVALAGLDLRMRIDRYTSVRAIAETADGRFVMRSGWVKASGGCSAPPAASEGGIPGEIRVRDSADHRSLLVSVRHPNHSGFQIDPKTGDAIPPHFIHKITVAAGGKPLISAETGISLSENPGMRVTLRTPVAAPVTIEAVDSSNAHFATTWQPAAVGAAPPPASQ